MEKNKESNIWYANKKTLKSLIEANHKAWGIHYNYDETIIIGIYNDYLYYMFYSHENKKYIKSCVQC